jgi:hypothetical protein
MKKNRDEPIQDIIHMYMEMSQGHSLCSYYKQAKMSFFSHDACAKSENTECNKLCLGGWYQWEGRGGGKRM